MLKGCHHTVKKAVLKPGCTRVSLLGFVSVHRGFSAVFFFFFFFFFFGLKEVSSSRPRWSVGAYCSNKKYHHRILHTFRTKKKKTIFLFKKGFTHLVLSEVGQRPVNTRGCLSSPCVSDLSISTPPGAPTFANRATSLILSSNTQYRAYLVRRLHVYSTVKENHTHLLEAKKINRKGVISKEPLLQHTHTHFFFFFFFWVLFLGPPSRNNPKSPKKKNYPNEIKTISVVSNTNIFFSHNSTPPPFFAKAD